MPTLEQKIRKHNQSLQELTSIELRHIMVAIEKSKNYAKEYEPYSAVSVAFLSNGEVYQEVYSYGNTEHFWIGKIDLSLPFSQWSPEVHEFINKLID